MLRNDDQDLERYYEESSLLDLLTWYSNKFQDATARANIKNAFYAHREVIEVPPDVLMVMQVNNLDILSVLNDEDVPVSNKLLDHSLPESIKKHYKDSDNSPFCANGLTMFSPNDSVNIRETSELINDMETKMKISEESISMKGRAY